MPDSDPSAHALDVPGARLYYERRGAGPLLLMIGFLAHLFRPTTYFQPDIEALRAAPTRIVVAAGATSKGQLPNRTAVALADRLGTTVVDFPGGHAGFVMYPEQCGRVLHRVLSETPS